MMEQKYLQKTIEFYNRLAPFWDRCTFKFYLPVWKRIIEVANIEAGAKVLEIGCGTGSLSILMALRGAKVTALDLSPKMVEVAKLTTDEISKAENLEIPSFQVGEASSLSFPDDFFDFVVMNSVIGDMPALLRLKVLSEAKRVAKRQVIVGDLWVPYRKFFRLLWLAFYPYWVIKNAAGIWSFYMNGFYEELNTIGFQLENRKTHWNYFVPMSVYQLRKV